LSSARSAKSHSGSRAA
jgi:hypothetical protein